MNFNPNEKNWEPLWNNTENLEIVSEEVIKYKPAPKDMKKPDIHDLPKSIEGHINVSLEKMTTFEERQDEFIFEHLARWYGSVTSLMGVTVIPKRLLIRAVECFKCEHREEFEAIMKGEKE